MNHDWETLGDRVFRTRLPYLDVTVGLVCGQTGVLLIDAGTTLAEADSVAQDVHALAGRPVSHIVFTHNHFDHILGRAGFGTAELYGAPAVAITMSRDVERLRTDAVRHGADPAEVDAAITRLRPPRHRVHDARIDLGGRVAAVSHPGRGHTDHDLVVAVPGDRTVVFCGDLVEQSGDPVIDRDSDVSAWPSTLDRVRMLGGADGVFVPGHGAVVDDAFVAAQQCLLRSSL